MEFGFASYDIPYYNIPKDDGKVNEKLKFPGTDRGCSMKIIHLISGGDVGGAKTHVLSLLRGLSQSQQVRLVCFLEGSFAQEARDLGITVTVMPERDPFAIRRQLLQRIREEQVQIIHCHGSRANMIGALLRGKTAAQVVTTVHSDYRLDYLGRFLSRLTYGTINTVALRHMDYHIGVSDSMVDLLISRGFDPQRLFSIYNGVDFSKPLPVVDRKEYWQSLGLSEPEGLVFGIAARLSAVKDVATAIRAFGRVAANRPGVRLLIAGDGEQSEELKQLAGQTCPRGSVIFAGWVSDMAAFYSVIDVNMLTSLSETFPYALTEGARQHLPTIASRVGGVPALIEHGVTGFLFPPRDDAALAGCMEQLAVDEGLRKKLADGLYEKASTQFSAEATVNRQIGIYETILRRAARKDRKRDGVLICGAYGKGNAGDDAILEAIVQQMREIDPDMPIYVLSRTPKQTKLRYRIGAVHTFAMGKWLRLMKKTKLYLNGGGSLIQDVTSSRSLHYYLFNIRCAYRTRNQVLMYGCGIGPVSRPGNRKKAGRVIDRCVDRITLREDSSAGQLEQLGVTRPKISVTADPALLLPPAPEERVESYMMENGLDPQGAYILAVLRPWTNLEEKLEQVLETLRYAESRYGLTPVFYALEPKRDLPVARMAAERLGRPCHILASAGSGSVMVGLMNKMKVVLSMRLHALIFAAGSAAQLIGIVYDPKVSGFLTYMGQSRYCLLEEVTAQRLSAYLDEAMAAGGARANVERLKLLARENETVARQMLEAEP